MSQQHFMPLRLFAWAFCLLFTFYACSDTPTPQKEGVRPDAILAEATPADAGEPVVESPPTKEAHTEQPSNEAPQPPEVPPEQPAGPIHSGEWEDASCEGVDAKTEAAASGQRFVQPKAQAQLDDKADGKVRCTVTFDLAQATFASLHLVGRASQTGNSPVAWLRLNQGPWVRWEPKDLTASWSPHDVVFDAEAKVPWHLWLVQGKNTLTVTWSHSSLALDRWELQPLPELGKPPSAPTQSPQRPIPQPTTQINVMDFGAKGDGTTDDSEALQNAIKHLEDKKQAGVVLLPEGRYLLKNIVYVRSSGVVLRGVGTRTEILADLQGNGLNWKAPIVLQGKACSTWWPLQKDAKVGEDTLTLPTDHKVKVGDTVEIVAEDSQEKHALGGKPLLRDQFDLVVVKAVSNDTLTLQRPLRLNFPTERKARLCVPTLLRDVGVEELSLRSLNDAETNGILVTRAEYPFVRGVHLSQIVRFGVHFVRTREARIEHNTYRNARRFGGGGQGYGFEIMTSVDSWIRFNHVYHVRHGIALQFGTSGTRVQHNEIVRSDLAGVDVHGEYNHHNTVEHNWLWRTREGVIVGGGHRSHGNDGPNNKVINNVIGPDVPIGLHVANTTPHTTLQNNRLFGGGTFGIFVVEQSHHTQILDNQLIGPWLTGIHLDGNDATIAGNTLSLDAQRSSIAISISKDSKRYTVQNNQLSGQTTMSHPNDPDSKVTP